MVGLRGKFKSLVCDESGLETIEYAIIGGLVTVGTLIVIGTLGVWIEGRFSNLLETLNTKQGN
jgi:Flp pilus assembly pilin Flp